MKRLNEIDRQTKYRTFIEYFCQKMIALALCFISACSTTPATFTPTESVISDVTTTSALATLTPTNIATSVSSSTPSAVPTTTPTFTAIPEPTPTSTPLSSYASLPPGLYIVYEKGNDGLDVVSSDGRYKQHLTDLVGLPVSYNGRYIEVYDDETEQSVILDLNGDTLLEVPKNDCGHFTGSPDMSQIAMWCSEENEIYVVALEDGNPIRVTNGNEQDYFSNPLWSPDGKWIAYFDLPFGPDTPIGLYLIDTACLTVPEACPENTLGPFQGNIYLQGAYSWSPNSQYLAILPDGFSGPIQIFSVQNGGFHSLKLTDNDLEPRYLAWSPDGRWMAIKDWQTEYIYLVPIDGDKPILLLDDEEIGSMFWLVVPFQVGDVLAISQEGANLNLREAPSLDGAILRKLLPGDTVTILEGPVEAEDILGGICK